MTTFKLSAMNTIVSNDNLFSILIKIQKIQTLCYIKDKQLKCLLFVSPDESQGYLEFTTVTSPPLRFPFGRDNLKNILDISNLVCGYIGNATNAIVL